jgi:large subunit ribosomal protein L6
MSRVGKNPVAIPGDVQCRMEGPLLIAKGKLGELKLPLSKEVTVELSEGKILVKPAFETKSSRMMWGTMTRMVSNLVSGVSKGFTRNLEITGVGYRASVQGRNLVLQLGYSHDIEFPIPSDIDIKCEKPTSISVTGIDKQRVGQIAAVIRSYRKPEPYKGKGVRYEDETILRKEGKKK